jgi:hypothetical protein
MKSFRKRWKRRRNEGGPVYTKGVAELKRAQT